MAHITKLVSLTDKLVSHLTGISYKDGSSRFNAYQESTLRTLRSTSYARTNHFDIQHQLEGLEEKFRIYDEDELADALHGRLVELTPYALKSTPEVLHLLLELSDKPVEKSKLKSLDFMRPPEASPTPRYTWEQLAAEDPLLRDGHVWQNIDHAAESSDDEMPSLGSEIDDQSLTETSSVSGISGGEPRYVNELTISGENGGLRQLQKSQFWKFKLGDEGHGSPVLLTELQVIREVLFLMSGLPTSLFLIQNQDVPLSSGIKHNSHPANYPRSPSSSLGEGIIEIPMIPSPGFTLNHASPQVLHAVLTRFAKDSASILSLRKWATGKETVPLLQSLQYEVIARISDIDSKLSDLQARLLEPSASLAISLTKVQAEIASRTRPLIKLSDIIQVLRSDPYAHPFRCLELLYAETCISQMAGDHGLYEYLGTLFFNCFDTYLRPIKTWMEQGEIGKEDTVFFVSEMSENLGLESIWSDRFRLRKTSSGTLHAPTFLHPAANRIFTTGKSVVVLNQLGKHDRIRRPGFNNEMHLDFHAVCGSSPESLAPFPELFDTAFNEWVKSKHCIASSTLRECLFEECGLRTSLNAMDNLYFMADGNITALLANAIFQRLDSGETTWNDRYVLTELVQSTIGSLLGVAAERLQTKISRHSDRNIKKPRLSVLSIATIAFTYSLPWPVQIIITNDTLPKYQKIFTFLLQIRRSSQRLQIKQLGQKYCRTTEQVLYYGLRSRLLLFNTTLYSYLTDLVISTSTVQMEKALSGADDIDGMINAHRTHMTRMIDQALLGSRLEPIQKSIITILDLSIHLSDAYIMHTSARDPGLGKAVSINDNSASHLPMGRASGLGHPHSKVGSPGMSDDNDSDIEAEVKAMTAEELEQSCADHIKQLQDEFDSLCKFVAIGLRGVARAGGEPNWDMLADMLESGSRAT